LVTIAVGFVPLLLGKWSPPVIATHAYCMAWSYAGLVAAGCGQLAIAVGLDSPAWVVPVVIATVLSISGAIIFGRVPSILDRVLIGVRSHDTAGMAVDP
jgi:tetrahydromethanopterin S-methyltransferase subunit C